MRDFFLVQCAFSIGGERAVVEPERFTRQDPRVEIGRIQPCGAEGARQCAARRGNRHARRQTGNLDHDALSCAASNSA
jgi:hypothetical protein